MLDAIKTKQTIADLWGDYIDWDKRRAGEGDFLPKILKEHNCQNIMNLAVGDGCDSVFLAKKGFKVVNNDFDKDFLRVAQENFKKLDLPMKCYSLDWTSLTTEIKKNYFDATMCYGNSLQALLSKEERIKALNEFRKITKPGGILIIDERNYQKMLDNKDKYVGKIISAGKYYYCGTKVFAKLSTLTDEVDIFDFYINGVKTEHSTLPCHPFKKGELLGELKSVGFKDIVQFSDFKEGENAEADFYQYVCAK